MKRFRQVFAWVLAFTMVCTNVDYVKADTVSEDIKAVTESAENSVDDLEESAESADISVGDLNVLVEDVDTSEEDFKVPMEDADISTEDVEPMADEAGETEEDTTAPEDTEIVHQGTFRGMSWSIDSNGLLLIDGQYDYEGTDEENPAWYENYYFIIKSAKISATGVKSVYHWFANCVNLTSVDMSNVDLSGVTDVSSMFDGYKSCTSLTSVNMSNADLSGITDKAFKFNGCTSLTNVDMSNVDLSNATYVGYMFSGCSNLTSVNWSGIKLGSVTDMSSMTNIFVGCTSLTSIDMSNADLSSVTDMQQILRIPENLSSVNLSNADISSLTDMSHMFDSSSVINVDMSNANCSPENMSGMFLNCSNLVSVDLSGIDASNVTDMSFMFQKCASLADLNLNGFKTDIVTNMSGMFYECCSLTSLDLSEFKTGNVTDMGGMFSGCSSLESLDISEFKTDNVTNMYGMFSNCSSLTSLDLSSFNMENVTDIRFMFDRCSNLKYLNLTGLNAGNITNMSAMFQMCSSLESLNLSGFKTDNVTDMSSMFNSCSNLTELEISGFKTDNVTDMGYMFIGCSSLSELKVNGFKTGNVTNMKYMFSNCSSLESLDLSGFNTSNVTDMSGMFNGCGSLTNLDLSGFNTSSVMSMKNMFSRCSSLESLDLSGFKTDNVTDMSSMFMDCSGLVSLNLSGLDASNVMDMTSMFYKCSSLTNLNLSGFKTKNVTDMNYMFYNCSNLTSLDISNFDTNQVTDMHYMFLNCSSLTDLDVSSFDTSQVTDMHQMFQGCSSLTDLDLSNFDTSQVTDMKGMFSLCSGLTSLDISGFNMDNVESMNNMLYGCTSIQKIKTFPNLQQEIPLPVSPMYDADLQQYDDHFPTGLTRSIWLYASKSDAENAEPEPEPEPNPQVTYTVIFDSGLGDEPIRITDIAGGTKITLPARPVREGYVFQGWFTEPDGKGTAFTEETVVNGDMTVYAYWKAVQSTPDTTENAKGFRISKVEPQTYTGSAIKPVVIVYDGEKLLTEKVDYTVSYKNNTKVNDATVEATAPTIIITGKGDYTGKETVTFPITAKNLNDEDISVADIFAAPTGKVQTPVPTVTWQNKKLSNKKDFEISYPDLEDSSLTDAYKAAGAAYRVKIKGINNFAGEREITFHITTDTLMSKVKVKSIPKQTYNGSAIEPALTVTCGKETLNLGTDYTVSYKNNIEAGKATVILTGIGDYAGTKEVTFQIVGTSIAKATVNGLTEKVYNGQEQTQNIQVQLAGKTLEPDKDYRVSYDKNLNVGTATVTITGIGGYSGTVKKTFKITAYDLSVDESHLIGGFPKDGMSVSYTKGGSTPEVNISFDGTELTAKKDYTVSYSNNKKITDSTDAKKPTITIKGKGNFKGTKTISFNIIKRNLTEEPVDIFVSDMPYVNKAGKYISKPVLTDMNGKKLAAGTDYEKTITYTLTDTGEALDKTSIPAVRSSIKVTITGKGSYEGTMETTYRIASSSFSSAKITITPQSYTGSAVTLTEKDITVKIGKDTVLTYGKDYEIVEGSYQNNVKKGTASVIIKGVGDYAGTKTVKFKITAKSLK